MTADNLPDNSGSTPSAGGEELSIPKHRFDEVNAKLRRMEEELQMKDQLYLQDRQRMMAALQPQSREPEITPEETGLDPQTHQAVVKAASVIAGRAIAREKQVFEQQIGMLASRTEKAELLAEKGADSAKHIPEIQRMQMEHAQRTGGFLPANIALEMIRSREKDEHIRRLEAKLAAGSAPQGGAQTPPVTPTPPSVPSPAGTRSIPSGGALPAGGAAPKPTSESSLEELEARLEEQFRAGNVL